MLIVKWYPILLSVGDVYGGQLGWKRTGWVDSLWVAVPSHLFCYWDGRVLCELLYVWPHVLLLSTAPLHCISSQKFNLGKKRIEMSLIRNWINIDKYHLPLHLLFPFLPLWTNWTQIANLLLIFMGYNGACKFFLLQIYRRLRPVTCSVHPHDSPPWGRRLQRARNSSQVW